METTKVVCISFAQLLVRKKSQFQNTAEQNNVMCAQIQSVAKILDQIAPFAKIKGAIKWY